MIKITNLELENIKRIKAVQLTPSESGLTVIGGNNGQGKTSVLDGIAWALGGDKFKPSQPQRDGSVIPPHLRVTLSNGLIVERKGDRGTLKITDPNGGKGGQQLLNEFIGQLALDLPKFMQATSKEKAQTLLRIIGVGDKLAASNSRSRTPIISAALSGRSPTRSRSTPTSSRTTPKPPPRKSAFPSCSAVSRRYSRRTAKISACGRTAIYASRSCSAPSRSTTAPRKSSPAHSRQPRPPESPPPTSRTKAPPKSRRISTTSTLSTRKSGQGASATAPSWRRRRPASSTTS